MKKDFIVEGILVEENKNENVIERLSQMKESLNKEKTKNRMMAYLKKMNKEE